MDSLFSSILNMTMTGSIVILLVIPVRFVLRKSPKIFSYALWAVVLFRLLCPVALTAPVSLLKPFQPEVKETSDAASIVYFLPSEEAPDFRFVPSETPAPEPVEVPVTDESAWGIRDVLPWLWAAGFGTMLVYSGIQYMCLRKKLISAIAYRKNVYLADGIDMPFVLGIFRPRIYMPSGIPEGEREFITAHERHHIRRGDPIIKMLAFLALCIHWFNPLVWLAFQLAGRDMEMSCDEAVIRQMGTHIRADYSAALLRLATHRKTIAGTPLAFGEGDTKGRVMNMAKWKKPGLFGLIICLVLCVALVIGCGVNPATIPAKTAGPAEVTIEELSLWLPEGLTIEQDAGKAEPSHIIRKGETIVGGVYILQKPSIDSNSSLDPWDWVAALNVPEKVPEERFIMNLNVPRNSTHPDSAAYGKKGIVETTHYFFEGEAVVYDLWFDMRNIPEAGVAEILKNTQCITTSNEAEVPKPTLGNWKFSNGYFCIPDQDQNIVITDGETNVGGVMFYAIPEGVYDPNDTIYLWLEKVGIPDFEDTSLCYMGGMTRDEGWMAEFASDVPPGTAPTVNRRHLFQLSGNYVVDIWVDLLKVDYKTAEELLAGVSIIGSAPAAEETNEDYEEFAFQKCAAIFNAVQNGPYQISHHHKNSGNEGPSGYAHTYWEHENDWMHISTVLTEGENISDTGSYYSRHASLCFAETFFNNHGHQGEHGDITWVEASPMDTEQPWLARFYWAKANVTYMDHLYDTDGSTFLYRIDKRYEDLDGYSDHYFAAFRFDSQGRFQNVVLDVNLYQDNAFTVTESIVSLEADSVAADIYEQYAHASGGLESVAAHPLDNCRSVIEAIQSLDAWKIVTQRKNSGGYVINDSSTMHFWKHGENWLHTNAIPESDGTFVMASCYIDGKFYDTYGPEAGASTEGEPIHWQETDETENGIPWLAICQWNDDAVTVTAIEKNRDGTAVHLHFQDAFRLGSLEAREYTTVFLFDRTDKFVSATVTVDFPDHHSITETMSVASIDADAIAREIAELGP